MRAVFILLILFQLSMGDQILLSPLKDLPLMPEPYGMRDWEKVARSYDSLVFSFQASGEYLPLIKWVGDGVNYPGTPFFSIPSYVGQKKTEYGEAINVMPAVVGAMLCGIDKTGGDGYNWALMCREYFNRDNGENIYLNQPQGSSGNDWWYETMPNVYFYQLYHLAGSLADFSRQFNSVAHRWLQAVKVMGGGACPWTVPEMGYRAFNFSKMEANPRGVPEPEAAGAIAWILYHAYKETGMKRYLQGAEWCMEYLNALAENPSYELQLSYGALTAAKMNAEVGTDYDCYRILNWCFGTGPLRNWGVINEKWGDYDCYGLIGENGYNGYAFLMNTFQQMAALTPLVRYDERFALSIGRWALHAANACRLFYHPFLPDDHQDDEKWAGVNDPKGVVAYEALREFHNGVTCYATGDARRNGWAETNLSLYASSSVGYMGAIVETTVVEKILKLNVSATDFFNESPFPELLLYNPYDTMKNIPLLPENGPVDVYHVLENQFVGWNIIDTFYLSLPPGEAALLVFTPSEGDVTHEGEKTFVNGFPIDYQNGRFVENHPPRIKALAVRDSLLETGDTTILYCSAVDNDGGFLEYGWSGDNGIVKDSGGIAYYSSGETGKKIIVCEVKDQTGERVKDSVRFNVVSRVNNAPVIREMEASPRKMKIFSSCEVFCRADDEDEDSLFYLWSSDNGCFGVDTLARTFWKAPDVPGIYYLRCQVSDSRESIVSDSIKVLVTDSSVCRKGDVILDLNFNDAFHDESEYAHNVYARGVVFTDGLGGSACRAAWFDGYDDGVMVQNSPFLNGRDSISVCFWMRVDDFFQRESFPISHGSWQNRWKVSLFNNKVRWTINTDQGIVDLDSETEIIADSFYFVSVLYDGKTCELYINGELDAFRGMTGKLRTTDYDLSIGKTLPDNNEYNFRGVLDEIKIFNYALAQEDIRNLFELKTSSKENAHENIHKPVFMARCYPNPFSTELNVEVVPVEKGFCAMTLYDILGRKKGRYRFVMGDGENRFSLNGKNIWGDNLANGVYFLLVERGTEKSVSKVVKID